MTNNKSAVSFHPQDKSSGSHSTILIDSKAPVQQPQGTLTIKGSFKALQRFSDTLLNEPNIVKAGERISVKLQED